MRSTARYATLSVLSAASFGLIGCASGLPGLRPLTYSTPGEARVYVSPGPCPHEPAGAEVAALLTALVTGVASQALTSFGTALQKGAEGGALPTSVSSRNMTPALGSIPRCIVVVRGSFNAEKGGAAALSGNELWGDAQGPGADEFAARADLLKMDRVYRVDHLIELRMLAAPGNNALTFSPIHMHLKQSLDGATHGSRDFSIALNFERVGATAVGSTVLLAHREIGKPSPLFVQDKDTERYPREAPWFASFHAEAKKPANASVATGTAATSAASAATVPAAAAASAPGGVVGGGGPGLATPTQGVSTGANLYSLQKDAVPVTLTATVVETRPTREGLAFVASVFGAVKPKLEEEIKQVIDPSLKQAADETAQIATINAQVDYDSAVKVAMVALIAYCKTTADPATDAGRTELITKSSDARIAQQKANVSAMKANLTPLSYPRLVTISSTSPSANEGCQ